MYIHAEGFVFSLVHATLFQIERKSNRHFDYYTAIFISG